MDQFLSGFESAMGQEQERLSAQEEEVARVAAAMSADLERAGHLPTAQGFSVMRDDLAFKEGEAEKSRNTLEGVNREHAQLQANLEKVGETKKSTYSQCTFLFEVVKGVRRARFQI